MRNELFGWITPNRHYVQTGQWNHAQAYKDEQLTRLLPDLEEWVEDVNRVEADCQALVDAGEHGEWHCLDFAQDDFQSAVTKGLLQAGCVRVATERNTLHFEGTPEAITNLMQYCKDFAEENGKDYNFDPRKFN